MEIDELTPAERTVWEAVPKGRPVDFRRTADESPADGAGWGPERTVRAVVLKALLLDGPLRSELGARARTHTLAAHDLRRATDAVTDVYRELLGGPTAPVVGPYEGRKCITT